MDITKIEHKFLFEPYFDSANEGMASDRSFSIFTPEHVSVNHIENSYQLYFFDGSTKIAECETAYEAVMQNKGQRIVKVIKNAIVVSKGNHKII